MTLKLKLRNGKVLRIETTPGEGFEVIRYEWPIRSRGQRKRKARPRPSTGSGRGAQSKERAA